jgi:hypothetical protein
LDFDDELKSAPKLEEKAPKFKQKAPKLEIQFRVPFLLSEAQP